MVQLTFVGIVPTINKNGQWLWLSWWSGRFQFQRSAVRIQSSAKIYIEFTVNCIEKTKINKKRPGMAHLFLKNNVQFNLSFVTKCSCSIGLLIHKGVFMRRFPIIHFWNVQVMIDSRKKIKVKIAFLKFGPLFDRLSLKFWARGFRQTAIPPLSGQILQSLFPLFCHRQTNTCSEKMEKSVFFANLQTSTVVCNFQRFLSGKWLSKYSMEEP